MTQDKPKPADDLRMPADDFDRIMQQALGVPAPVEIKNPRGGRHPRKSDRPVKK